MIPASEHSLPERLRALAESIRRNCLDKMLGAPCSECSDEAELAKSSASEIERQQAELVDLKAYREYKTNVNGVIGHLIGENPSLNHEWGGNRSGWGFVFEWVKWISARLIKAEAELERLRGELKEKETK